MPDSQLAGKTDQRLGIPVLPLNCLLLSLLAARDELLWPLPCAMGASHRPRCRSRACRLLPRLRAEESSLLTARTLKTVKERVCFYSSCFQSQRNYRNAISFVFNRVQLVHRPVPGFGAISFDAIISCCIHAIFLRCSYSRHIIRPRTYCAIDLWEIRQKAPPERLLAKYDFVASVLIADKYACRRSLRQGTASILPNTSANFLLTRCRNAKLRWHD